MLISGEILLLRIVGKIAKWQHGERANMARAGPCNQSGANVAPVKGKHASECYGCDYEGSEAQPQPGSLSAFRRCRRCFRLRTCASGLDNFNRSDKTIPVSWQRRDEPWILGVVPQCLAQFFHSSINAVFKVYEGIGGPEFLPGSLPASPLRRVAR